MIISALISEARRESNDQPRSIRTSRRGNGSVNLFNTGHMPIIENSYNVYVSGVLKQETSDYTIDLDNGDIHILSTPANDIEVRSEFKYANWRDKNWVEAINDGIQALNARGFFKQAVRVSFPISAGVRTVNGPSGAIDIYELLNSPRSGVYSKLNVNWSYQQDVNKIVLGGTFSTQASGAISYLRNLQTYSAVSATIDVKTEWIPLVKKFAVQKYMEAMASKIATQGNASIEEGHFSFTNARTQANTLRNEFQEEVARAKPTRPAKDIEFKIDNGGIA